MSKLVDMCASAVLPLIDDRIFGADRRNPFLGEPKEGKFLVFFGGGNGSGKTVLANVLFDQLESNGYDRRLMAKFGSSIFEDILSNRFLNTLRGPIEQFLHSAASSHEHDPTHKPGFLKQVALTAFQKECGKCMDMGVPVIIDYHMHDPVFVNECVKSAREHGYETILISPHLDAENIHERLQTRKETTGKPYDLPKVLTRHKQFAENLDGYLHLFDLSVIVDNNRVGKPPRMIALAHQGDVTVFNEEAYEKVKRKAHLNPLAASQEELWQPEPSATAGTQEHAGTFANRVGRSHQQNQPGGNTGAGKEKGPFAAMIEEGLLNQFSPKQR